MDETDGMVGSGGPRWLITDLRPIHDRTGFRCGSESLDRFLEQFARQNERSGLSRTAVACPAGTRTVVGFYSLAAGSVSIDSLPERDRRRLPRHPVPTALIGRLAVDQRHQRQGLGDLLVADALRRIESVSRAMGIHAAEVEAIDATARTFYRRFGFLELLDDPNHLYLPIATVRRSLTDATPGLKGAIARARRWIKDGPPTDKGDFRAIMKDAKRGRP